MNWKTVETCAVVDIMLVMRRKAGTNMCHCGHNVSDEMMWMCDCGHNLVMTMMMIMADYPIENVLNGR